MENIAIIGSGNIWANLGRLFASKHNVTLGSRNPEQTRTKLPGIAVTDRPAIRRHISSLSINQ
jgi:predicted dinucleotide-binding enzyme